MFTTYAVLQEGFPSSTLKRKTDIEQRWPLHPAMPGLPREDRRIFLEREAKEENKARVHHPSNPVMSLMIPDSRQQN